MSDTDLPHVKNDDEGKDLDQDKEQEGVDQPQYEPDLHSNKELEGLDEDYMDHLEMDEEEEDYEENYDTTERHQSENYAEEQNEEELTERQDEEEEEEELTEKHEELTDRQYEELLTERPGEETQRSSRQEEQLTERLDGEELTERQEKEQLAASQDEEQSTEGLVEDKLTEKKDRHLTKDQDVEAVGDTEYQDKMVEADDLVESYREFLENQDTQQLDSSQTEIPLQDEMENKGTMNESGRIDPLNNVMKEKMNTSDQSVLGPNNLYKDSSATVRFLLVPSQQVATVRCNLLEAFSEIKQQIATDMKIKPQVMLLMFEGKKIPDESNLFDLGVHPNGTIQLQLHSVDPVNHPIQAFRPRQEYHMPDVITVRIPIDNQNSRDVVVEIEKEMTKKPWLGGYRDKKQQTVFHNAAVQTMPKPLPPHSTKRFSRDTQTSKQKHAIQQTANEMATQMTKIGTYVSCDKDKIMVPGRYTTADDFVMTRLMKAIIIQKYYRRWSAKLRVAAIREAEKRRQEWEKEQEILKTKEKEERIQREYERRMNPKSKEDFDLLYHALEKWRREEEERINSTLSGAERKAALYMLLEQETQLIASIGRHKIEADVETKNRIINDFLEKAAAPKRWSGRDGKTTEMDTPYTLRALQLKDIYNSINMKYLTQDERLDALLTLKHTVKEHDCKLTQEIIKLIDREADLLMRGVQERNLDGLRKRISTLFLVYIKTPLFNPEAARLSKVPQDPSVLRQNIYFCPSCTRYLPSTEFKLSSSSKAVSRCRKCIQKNNQACLRQDLSHFRYMLRHVCRTEEAFGTGSKIAFLMQENDIRYLVENVWDSQSVLSAMDDLYELVLIRWDQKAEWSPWNCILLTKDEASAHSKLENVNEAYGQEFLHRVRHKHTLAKNHFSRLPKMAEYLRLRRDNSAATSPISVSFLPPLSGKRMSVTPTAV